jgi:branched-chain amino acid transport system substrate-binding protein
MINWKAAVVGASVAAFCAGTAQAREIKVGFIATFSGPAAQLGTLLRKGAELYNKQHKNELKGDTIKLIFRDTKNPGGAVAKSVAQELITRDKVDVIGGIVFSPNAMSLASLATQAKVPIVVMNAGTSFITNMSPNIARVSFTMWQAGFIMGQHAAKDLKCKTAVAGFTNYPPGKDSVAAFKRGFEGAGGKLIDAIPMGGPGKVPDFTPFLQRAKDQKPGCLYVFVPGGNHATAVLRVYKQLGMKAAGIKLIGPGDITQDTLLQGMGAAAVGLVTASHYYADLDNPTNKAFIAAWKKEYGANTTPDFVAVGGYDGMAAIYHVIKTVKGKITAAKAMAALKGWTHNSPRGKIMIDPKTRDIVQNIYIATVEKKGGRLVEHVQETFKAVKDKCKQLKIGRCGK